MNNQFFLCHKRDTSTGGCCGINLSAIESFYFSKKGETTESRMIVHLRDNSIELKGADAERLLAAMNLSA